MNSFSETTNQSWFSRIGAAFKGLLVGVIASVGSVFLLFWNEGRAVQTAKSLSEGAGAVVTASADNLDGANEGNLVHISGEATTEETLTDEEYNISRQAIRLERNVEMYQWDEEKRSEERKKLGGGTETTTTYTYNEVWSASPINSDNFHKKSAGKYQNPDSWPVTSRTQHAKSVTVGAYTLSDSLRNSVRNPSTVSVNDENIPETMSENMTVQDQQTLYYGQNPESPQIGDCRISFVATEPAVVSVIAQQTGSSFQPYQTEAGDALSMLRMKQVSAEQMFEMAQADNRTLTWILRLVGVVIMFVGLMMFSKPLTVLADVVPIFGNIAEFGFAIVAGLLTIAGASATIGFAWLYYRPLIGVPLLAVSVGAIVMLFRRKRKPAAEALASDTIAPIEQG